MSDPEKLMEEIDRLGGRLAEAKAAIATRIIGQDEVVNLALAAMLSGGHALLMGLPGMGKTLLVDTLSKVMGLSESRIQFTPDLMPADILGSEVLETGADGARSFRFIEGPVFCQLLMADEINRASPRTQSALLQAMQEMEVTVAGVHHALPRPFHVLATQNPIEQEGTYPLPEAQLDRFLLNPVIDYLSEEDEIKMVGETTGVQGEESQAVLTGEDILQLQSLTRQVPAPEAVVSYAVAIASASRPQSESCDEWTQKRVKWGAGSRGSQALILASKARAMLDGRPNASREDVRAMAKSGLRHRILPSFFAESEGLNSDGIIDHILENVAS